MAQRKDLANAVRALSMDAVQKANSGHPGAPMGMADIAEVLWNDNLKHNPGNPKWSDRDRFILSNSSEERLFPIDKIEGVQVLLANKFEFYYEGSLYKFEFSNTRCSGYKYMCAIQKIAPEKTELQ